MRKAPFLLAALPVCCLCHGGAANAQSVLEEITVTATKRSETLQDVPLAVTAVTAQNIEKRGLAEFNDYLPTIPGIAFQDRGAGRNKIVIRGVSSGVDPAENPTVATYFGESLVSVLPTTQQSAPNIKLFDIERVEALRGPQGTLYGASSMGGTVRILPARPNLNEVEILAQAGINGTSRSNDLGYEFGGAISLPVVEDRLAVRATAYHYLDAGFIDNVTSAIPQYDVPDFSKKDVNEVEVTGVRLAATLQASERLSLTLTAFHQKTDAGALPDHNPVTVGDFRQDRSLREKLSDRLNLLNLDLTYGLDGIEFFSTTTYLERKTEQVRDLYGFYGVLAGLYDEQDGNFFSQEFRMASADDGPLQWIAGVYYSLEKGHFAQEGRFSGTTLEAERRYQMDLGLPLGPDDPPVAWAEVLERPETQQIAAFGELSYSFGRFTGTMGGRIMKYDQKAHNINWPSILGGAFEDVSEESSEKVFTPKFHVKYAQSEDVRYYAQAAKGFRIGAAAPRLPDICNDDLRNAGLDLDPEGTRSDSIWNYELGAKTRLADGRVTFNVAAFWIDWKDIQTNFLLPTCGYQVGANAGKASSKGLELELAALVADNLTLDLSASYVDAQLEEDTAPASGLDGFKGDRLPGVPKYNAHGGLQYDFLLTGLDGFARGDVSYVGGYYSSFTNMRNGVGKSGDHVLVDFRLGLGSGAWAVEAYAKNVFNRKVILLRDPEFPDGRETVGRPRTYGLVLRYRL